MESNNKGGKSKCKNVGSCKRIKSLNSANAVAGCEQSDSIVPTKNPESAQVLYVMPNFSSTLSEQDVFYDCISDTESIRHVSCPINCQKVSREKHPPLRVAVENTKYTNPQLQSGTNGVEIPIQGCEANLEITARLINDTGAQSAALHCDPYKLLINPVTISIPLKVDVQTPHPGVNLEPIRTATVGASRPLYLPPVQGPPPGDLQSGDSKDNNNKNNKAVQTLTSHTLDNMKTKKNIVSRRVQTSANRVNHGQVLGKIHAEGTYDHRTIITLRLVPAEDTAAEAVEKWELGDSPREGILKSHKEGVYVKTANVINLTIVKLPRPPPPILMPQLPSEPKLQSISEVPPPKPPSVESVKVEVKELSSPPAVPPKPKPKKYYLANPQHKQLHICTPCRFDPSPIIDENGQVFCPGRCGCCLCPWRSSRSKKISTHSTVRVCKCRQRGSLFTNFDPLNTHCSNTSFFDLCPCREKAEAKHLEIFECEMFEMDEDQTPNFWGREVQLSEVAEIIPIPKHKTIPK